MSTNPPPQSGRFFFLWIGLGTVALLALLFAALIGLLSFAATEAQRSPVTGEIYGDPNEVPEGALSRDECLDPCLTAADAARLVPEPDELFVGSTVIIEPALEPTSAQALFDAVHEDFYLGGGSPINCDFSLGRTTGFSDSNFYSVDDQAVDLGAYGDTGTLSQTVRVFSSTLNATRYPTFLSSVVTRCPQYSVERDGGLWQTEVERLDLPVADGVTSVAWTEQSSGVRVSTADLQFATLVVRTTYTRPDNPEADVAAEEAAFAAFVLSTSERLAGLG